MTANFLDKILALDSLPGRPVVALEVLRLTRENEVSLDSLIAVIEQDGSLAARILKVVNSSLFGLPRKVSSLRQAVVALGLRSIKMMAMSLSLVDALKVKDGGDALLDMGQFWRRSLTAALAGRTLAQRVRPAVADDAFMSGLLGDLGVIAAWTTTNDAYREVLRDRRPGEALEAAERRVLGISHAQISAALLRRWGLPEGLCELVALHHDGASEGASGEKSPALDIVRIAADLADICAGDAGIQTQVAVRAKAQERLGLGPEACDELLGQLNRQAGDTAALFAVQLCPAVDVEKLLAEAGLRLAALSAQTDQERATLADCAAAASHKVARLEHENRQLRAEVSHDHLTGVATRGAFEERLAEEFAHAQRRGYSVGLLNLDVDHFKHLNDTYGHRAGDSVLRHIAGALKDVVGRSGFVARCGGEEFSIIAPHGEPNHLRQLAEEIRTEVANSTVEHDQQRLSVTVSIGVAWTTSAGPATPDGLIEAADRALYQAKRAGRNRVMTAGEKRGGFWGRLLGLGARPAVAGP